MFILKSLSRGGGGVPLFGSLLAAAIVAVVAYEPVRAQPDSRPLDNAMIKPKAATPAAPLAAAPAPAAEAVARPQSKFDVDPVDNSNEMKKRRLWINAELRKTAFGPGEQAEFDKFYQEHELPKWTDPKTVIQLGGFRKNLHNDLQTARSGPIHDHLNALALEYMSKLIAGNYHPAVQANAMMMIGELNQVEQTPTALPVPLPAASSALLAAVGNVKLSDGVRAAAIDGIRHHAVLGIEDEEGKRSVTAAMLKIVAAVDPPGESAAGEGATGREWICRRAMDTLACLAAVGQNNVVFEAMLKTLADAKLSISTRSTAAESLGRLNYTGATGINAADVVAKLGQFLIDACKEEVRQANANAEVLDVLRRWTKQHLVAAKLALTGPEEKEAAQTRKGISPLLKEDERAFGDELRKLIEAKITFLDNPNFVNEELTPQVEELQKALEGWLQKKPK